MSETDCTEILTQIELYLDREIDDGARCAEIQRHLDLCPPCLERVDFQVNLRILVSKKCAGEALPAELQARVTEVIRAERA